jgi:hypothetical protein
VIEVALSIAREVALGACTWPGESRQVPHGELMPRSSSLAITIVRTATDAPADPGDIRALIDAAIEYMTQIAGLSEPTGPSALAVGAGPPDCGLPEPRLSTPPLHGIHRGTPTFRCHPLLIFCRRTSTFPGPACSSSARWACVTFLASTSRQQN